MPSGYTAFDPSKPDGSTQNGAAVLGSITANEYALWTAIAMGVLPGWSLTCSGGTAAQPTQFLFGNGATQRIKGVVSWTSNNITQIVWTVSQDSGATYSPTVATQVNTYDGSGNLTGTTGAAGVLAFFGMVIGKLASLTTRVATVETTIAGYGDMVSQAAAAVAITGGTIKGVTLGGTGSGEAKLAYLLGQRGKVIDLAGGTPANTFTLDFAAGDSFYCAPGANFTFAINNEPPSGFGQKCVALVDNAVGKTATLPSGYSWGGAGAPAWTSGIDVVTVYCRSDGTKPVKRFMVSSFGA